VKAISILFSPVLLALTANVGAQPVAPDNAITEIRAAFPSCDVYSSSVSPLYEKSTKDVASSLYCKADSVQSNDFISGPYALVILSEGQNGKNRIA